jgi:hypothetical protein
MTSDSARSVKYFELVYGMDILPQQREEVFTLLEEILK